MTRQALRAAALAALIASPVRAAEPRPLTVDWITSTEADQVTRLPRYTWMADGSILLFDERKPAAEGVGLVDNSPVSVSRL